MRILHVIATADPRSGGPIEGALRMGEIWAAEGHRQDLLTLDVPGAALPEDYPGDIITLGRPRTRSPLSRYGRTPGFVDWIRRNGHSYDAAILAGLWNYTAWAMRRGAGDLPYFVYTHGMLDPWFRRRYPLKHLAKQALWLVNEGPLLSGARRVLFTTADEQALAEKAFRPYRLRGVVAGYGTADVPAGSSAQEEAFRSRLPAITGRRFLLFLSRIHPKKGCDLLIEAFATLAAAHPDLDLVIAGPDQVGLQPKLAAIARQRGIAARVHFPGMLQGDAKWGAFRACEAFALTSHQENFGVVVAEALACGKPALISDKVNIWREVAEDGAGLLGPDTAEGSERLLRDFLALDPAARARMGIAARGCFERRFRIEDVAARTMDIIAGALHA
jgi:glycosyltransferase involved in cell wall biosynthesis